MGGHGSLAGAFFATCLILLVGAACHVPADADNKRPGHRHLAEWARAGGRAVEKAGLCT